MFHECYMFSSHSSTLSTHPISKADTIGNFIQTTLSPTANFSPTKMLPFPIPPAKL